MCGIVGCVLKEGESVDRAVLESSAEAIRHRGPDDSGLYISGNVGFAFRRLSIIDLSPTGHQPMFNDEKSVWLMFNGEVYNFQELRTDLEKRGYSFRSRSDTEVILRLYEAEGDAFVAKLRGMFAIALWDAKEKRLILARDRVGKKPLFYSKGNGRILFGSEIKSLLKFRGIEQSFDLNAIDEYFSFGFISAPSSIYKDIRKLQPGHILVYQDGRISIAPFWQLQPVPPSSAFIVNDATERLKVLVNESVRMRMISDVPLGAFLSGGIDSSAIVAFMAMNSSRPIDTFCIGFEESDFDETSHARIVADHFSTNHHEEIVRPNYLDILDGIILDFDEPFGDSSALPTYVVSRITRKYVTVALSGDGGDELFGGYDLYRTALRDASYERLPIPLKKLSSFAAPFIPRSVRGSGMLRRIGAESPMHRYIERTFTFNPLEKVDLFSASLRRQLLSIDPFLPKLRFQQDGRHLDRLNQFEYNDFRHYLPDDIMVKVDRMSMLNSLETRSPFLDHHVVEFAFTIPEEWKIQNGETKVLLRRALQGILPDAILKRGKMGFGVPVKHWFGNQLYAYCRELFNSDSVTKSGFFNVHTINSYLESHRSGRKDLTSKLWFILAFALFLQGREKGA